MLHIGVFIEGHQKDFFVSKHEARSVRIHLTKRAMSIAQDIFISIRILDACCYLTPPQNFCWEDESCDERIVEEGYYKIYQGLFEISIVVSHWTQQQMIFEKYAFVVGNSISIGREKENVLWVQHSLVTKHHGKLIKSQGNIAIYQDHSSNGTFINGVRCHNEQVPLQYGDCIYIAPDLRIIYLDSCIAVNGAKALKCCRLPVANIVATLSTTEASNSSKIYFHRSPRLIEPADNQEIDIEPPITKADNPSQPLWLTLGPSTTMVLPMLAGSLVMAQNGSGFMASGLVMVGTSAMLATMWGVVNSNHRKKQALITEKKRITLYRQYLGEVESLLKQRSAAELGRLCKNDLTAAQCITFPIHLDNRLWERMPGHMDFLSVRLGNGDVTLTPIAIPKKHLSMIEDPLCDEPARLQQQYKALYNAPYTISLRQRTFIGIIGEEAAQSLVYSIIVQATAMHSYNDLRLCVLCDESEADQWQWARWLAHNFTSENRDFRLVASCQRSITEALNHLYEVLNTRIEQAKEHQRESDAPLGDVKNQPLPHYVVICTKPELLEGQQLIHHLLRGYLGVTLLLLAPSMDYLPKECKLIINTETTNPGVFTPNGQVDRISFESISLDNAAQFAKAMAPIYVRDTTENTAIPNYVSFLDSYQIGSTEQLDVWRFWSENMTCDGLRAVIGLKSGAMPFVLDISERVHGPHGLIAGTTGSGKSVLLQTYILSLAINYAPSQIQFALIDYKGGGMANAFSSLPHVAGIISDIQGAQDIARALASVQGEIERRKHLLAVGHVENVDEYNRLYRNTNTKLISHLLIVVDEFAELRKENPEFMKELISAARVGRSLGIHLILATQKPANSVDDEIWSNTRFRLCLRVASRGDSMETLKRPDAAYLKEMGRCYVQVGSDELFEEVQTCFSGAPYHPHEIGPEQMPRLLNEVGKPITLKKQRSRSSNKEYTQMNAVLDRIKAVALEHHVSDAPQLWKKRLHSVLFLDQIDLYRQGKRGTYNKQDAKMDEIKVCVGYADDVAHQQYCPFAVDLTAKRNYLFVGMPQSGKTTTLQTIAIALAETYTPQQVQMYAFSLSSKVLGTLRHLPHVGGIVFDDEPEEEIRLLVMLEKESQRRKDWFAKASTDSFLAYSQVSQGDTVLPTLPAVVVFVDRLFQAKELMGDDAFARLTNLMKEGSSCGLFFIATALSMSEVHWKIQSCFHPIALENSTRSEYGDILGKRVPNEMTSLLHAPGRAMACINGDHVEIQIGIYNPDTQMLTDIDRAKAIVALGEDMSNNWTGVRPQPVMRIPQKPVLSDLLQSLEQLEKSVDSFLLPFGYQVMEGTPYCAQLWDDCAWMTIGPPRSGKTTFLKNIAKQMTTKNARLLVVTNQPDQWRCFSSLESVLITSPDSPESKEFLIRLDEDVSKRLEKRKQHSDEKEQKEAIAAFQPVAIFIDNIEQIQEKLVETCSFLATMSEHASHFGVYIFVSSTPGGVVANKNNLIIAALIQKQCVLALRGRLSGCDLFETTLSFQQKNALLPMGYAYLVTRGDCKQLIVPNV